MVIVTYLRLPNLISYRLNVLSGNAILMNKSKKRVNQLNLKAGIYLNPIVI